MGVFCACFSPASGLNPGVLWFGLLVSVVTAFGVGAGVGYFLRTRRNLGEALVAAEITARFPRRHILLNNVTFQSGTETTQLDHILVADTGIFIIETKHYRGWIFGDATTKTWTQVIYRHKSRFQNPLHQNYGHIKTLQALFTLPKEAYAGVVVFTGPAEFKTARGPGVVKLAELIAHLSQERPVIFDERKMAYIVGRIEMQRLRRSVETDEYHLNSVLERLQQRH